MIVQWAKLITLTLQIMKNTKPNRDRSNKGEKVYHFKGTFDEVWEDYLKMIKIWKKNLTTKKLKL